MIGPVDKYSSKDDNWIWKRSGGASGLLRAQKENPRKDNMVLVKSLTGETAAIDIDTAATVQQLKDLALQLPAQGKVTHCGRDLKDDSTLAENGVSELSVINATVSIKGGHCQVPCGIFDDPKFVAELKEHAATIRKAMLQISTLHQSGGSALDFNQMVRWVTTKEDHCKKIISSVTEYSLCQRVKPKGVFKTEKDYLDALKAHHNVLIAAMKAKQGVEAAVADALDHAIDDCCKMYIP